MKFKAPSETRSPKLGKVDRKEQIKEEQITESLIDSPGHRSSNFAFGERITVKQEVTLYYHQAFGAALKISTSRSAMYLSSPSLSCHTAKPNFVGSC